MNNEVDKKTVRQIISLAMLGAVAALLAQHIDFGPKEVDQNFDRLMFAIGASIMGVLFLVMKKKNIAKYAAESMELLFFIIIPVTAFIPLLSSPDIHFATFFPVYLLAVSGWLLLSKHYIMEPIDTDEKKKTWSGMKRLWAFLMGLSILIFPFYLLTLPNG